MHTLGYSFRPWDGEKSIADGDSILHYIKDTARETGVDAHIRFGHRVTGPSGRAPTPGGTSPPCAVTPDRRRGDAAGDAGFLFACTGYYRYDHGYLPDFAGMEDFAGTIVHPQALARWTSTSPASASSSSGAAPRP